MYCDMASRHEARKAKIQIIATNVLEAKQCRRPATIQYLSSKLRFPVPNRLVRPSSRQFKNTFAYRRPNVCGN